MEERGQQLRCTYNGLAEERDNSTAARAARRAAMARCHHTCGVEQARWETEVASD